LGRRCGEEARRGEARRVMNRIGFEVQRARWKTSVECRVASRVCGTEDKEQVVIRDFMRIILVIAA
jgi:hypothetical protein